ncbi:MAG: FRG domain-containing protein [Treponematales bacterium]
MIIHTIQDYENIDRRQYLFRGQSNKDWQLLPGVYRDCSINSPALEKEVVNRFIRHLMENGYKLFPTGTNLIDILTKPEADVFAESPIFPHEELLPYLALAQHYAFDSQFAWLKTSLLDVTHNLDIAAYFAVESGGGVDGKIFVFDPFNNKRTLQNLRTSWWFQNGSKACCSMWRFSLQGARLHRRVFSLQG